MLILLEFISLLGGDSRRVFARRPYALVVCVELSAEGAIIGAAYLVLSARTEDGVGAFCVQ